jgi:hypothetical protein
MRIAVLRQIGQTLSSPRPTSFTHPLLSRPYSKLSSPRPGKMAVSYAAAVSTPDGGFRQPQIQARACSDPDMRASFEADAQKKEEQKRNALEPGSERRPASVAGGLRRKGKVIGICLVASPISLKKVDHQAISQERSISLIPEMRKTMSTSLP